MLSDMGVVLRRKAFFSGFSQTFTQNYLNINISNCRNDEMTEPMLIAPLSRLEVVAAANGGTFSTVSQNSPIIKKNVKPVGIYGLQDVEADRRWSAAQPYQETSPSVRKFQKSGPRARCGPRHAATAVSSSKGKLIRSKGNNINNVMAINNKSTAAAVNGTTAAMKHRLEL